MDRNQRPRLGPFIANISSEDGHICLLPSTIATQFMKDEYPDGKSDLFAGFIERCVALTAPRGATAMITMQSWMFLSSYENLRSTLLKDHRLASMLHLGARAFDSIGGEVVSSTAFVLINKHGKTPGMFIRLVAGGSEAEKAADLMHALNQRSRDAGFHQASGEDFAAIPGSPVVYWLSEKMRAAFRESPALERRSRSAKGLVTAENAAFVRFWWEVAQDETGFDNSNRKEALDSRRRWFPYAKGGEFRRWAGNLDSVVDWQDDGHRLQTTMTADGARVRATNFNLDRIFRAGLAWTVVTSGEQSFRKVPRGCLFDAAAGMCQSDTDEIHLAVLNSHVVSLILSAINPTLNLHPGYLGAVPVPKNASELSINVVTRLVETSESDWDEAETAWGFQLNPLVALVRTSPTDSDA
jgi:hypothetical protein